jgi:DNA-binding XRE family transcriptional regulator
VLSLEIIQEVKRMLDKGEYSQRKIAQILDISRGTVNAIASGKRGLHGAESEKNLPLSRLTPERCGGCGALVYMPCVLCQARAYRELQAMLEAWQANRPKRVA